MKKLFKIGGKLPKKTILIIEIIGLLLFLLIWYIITKPIDEYTLSFNSSVPDECKYEWSSDDNYNKNFDGDNSLTNINPGTYTFTATDNSGNKISESITVPEIKDSTFTKEFTKNELFVAISVKAEKQGWLINKGVLPSPGSVLTSIKLPKNGEEFFNELRVIIYGYDPKVKNKEKSFLLSLFVPTKINNDNVISNTIYSLKLNIYGYLEAVFFSLLLGFLIALIPGARALMSRWVNAIRFIPLTAVTGLFIAWFGIASNMKIQFLAFGIFVYLLPVVVQRIDEVQKIYLQTAYTLGASKWQLIKTVYWPAVISKIIDDTRVLTAISWTYIILAELLNNTGGIGSMIFKAKRESGLDKVFALLIIIIIIGIIQDKFFEYLDKKINRFKYKAEVK